MSFKAKATDKIILDYTLTGKRNLQKKESQICPK